MTKAAIIADRVESVYRGIHQTRMRDIPILNAALSVQAVGFRRHEDHWLGALVTPWSINLLRLPILSPGLSTPPTGSVRTLGFPAGEFEFIAGYEPGIGAYESCSLYSPVNEFADQAAAVATAFAAIDLLFDERVEALDEAVTDPARQPRGITRRALLRGRLQDPGA